MKWIASWTYLYFIKKNFPLICWNLYARYRHLCFQLIWKVSWDICSSYKWHFRYYFWNKFRTPHSLDFYQPFRRLYWVYKFSTMNIKCLAKEEKKTVRNVVTTFIFFVFLFILNFMSGGVLLYNLNDRFTIEIPFLPRAASIFF